MPRITSRAERRESFSIAPTGFVISIDGKRVGGVSPIRIGFQQWDGWYFYVSAPAFDIPHRNTGSAKRPYKTKDEARKACVDYIKEQLEKNRGKDGEEGSARTTRSR